MKKFFSLQLAAWLLLFILYYFYLNSRWPNIDQSLAVSHAVIAFLYFALMIYGYSLFLFPQYFEPPLTLRFVAISLCYFGAVYCLRIVTESELIPTITSGNKGIFYYGKVQVLYNLVSSLIAFTIAVLFTHVFESLRAERREHEITHRQLESELKFLKSQVQPHFLFNSLNNIYYDTYKELPGVAARISMLAEIMRYFLEESQKETVSINKEIQILNNYIDLEKERFHGANIVRYIEVREEVEIPPMLLMPLVENLFKHVRFSAAADTAQITIICDHTKLEMVVKNPYQQKPESQRKGTGLDNLRKRLNLYYKSNFYLSVTDSNSYYTVFLRFPIRTLSKQVKLMRR